jgi:hypothetical protein
MKVSGPVPKENVALVTDVAAVTHGDLSADEVSQQFRQAIVFAFQPVVLDRHVFALDVPRCR